MSEIKRRIGYRVVDDELEPFLIISPKVECKDRQVNFAIRMNDLWMYTPDKNPNFESWMYHITAQIAETFKLGMITSQRMADIASNIEDGISDLLSAKPYSNG